MTRSPVAWKCCSLAIALVLGAAPGHAQMAASGFEGYKHVRAAADDGAPDGILRVAQTGDGYMWFAGDALYRFDGATFEQVDWAQGSGRRHASPSGIKVGRNGDLWVGMRDSGGVAVYRNGALHDMKMPDPPRGIGGFAFGADGSTWASSAGADKRLWRLRGGQWQRLDEVLTLPPGYIMDMVIDRTGGLWVALSALDGKSGSLAYLPTGAKRFRPVPVTLTGRPKIALDRAGSLWTSDGLGTRRLFDAAGERVDGRPSFPPVPNVTRAAFAFDRDGGIWGTTGTSGIFYIADPGRGGTKRPAIFSAANGLTSDTSLAPFVDREGNIWIGTENGIDQFRRASAVRATEIPADPTAGLSIAREASGSILIASHQTLYRIAPHDSPRKIMALSQDVSLCPSRDGGVWVVGTGRTLLIRGDTTQRFPPYPGGSDRLACAADGVGRLWLALASGKLLWRDGGGWHVAGGKVAALSLWDIAAMPNGDLAIISPPNAAILSGTSLRTVNLEKTGIGTPWAMFPGSLPGSGDFYFSGATGLARLRSGQLRAIDDRRFPWIGWTRTMQQTANGETWLFSRAGLYRVATADFERAFDDPRAALPATKFNTLDGLESTVQHGGFAGEQSALSPDGRIWFLNRQGAAFLDPATLPRNKLVPPIVIRSLSIDGQTWRDPSNLILPAGTRTINLAYAGLSFTVPQRVRFRYMLEGADSKWVDAGSRRTASYSNLGPGKYRFHVIGSNNDGVWNRTGAALDFEIRPTFVQDWPFRLLCALALIGLLWLVYDARLRAVSRGIRLRIAERIEERERIARELHDTLLQAIQSLTLRFQLAADDLPQNSKARASLVDAIDTADRVIAEGRDKVRELRSKQDGDVEQILCDVVARAEFPPDVAVNFSTVGTVRRLDPLAAEEVMRIANEALFNVRRHADARTVQIQTRHGSHFELHIIDDGRGIDPEVAARGAREGHFGLVGMAERARKLRGTFRVAPRPDGGTEAVLTVPGTVAYKASPTPWSL